MALQEKPKILVVEDEGIVAMDLSQNLVKLAYNVVGVCSTAEDALSKVAELKPDLVLLDIKLKGVMDGINAARIIRAEFNIPVVFLTSYSDQTTMDRAKETEPFGYILKPYDQRELFATIEIALYKNRGEKRLKEDNQNLERLSKVKTEFTSMVSHELRTPLSAIKEGINIVLDEIDGPINTLQRETLTITKESVERLTRLINHVLDYSKFEAGKMELFFKELVMNDLVTSVYKSMLPAAKKKNISMKLEIPQNVVKLSCDEDKIKQVIVNLIDNAIRFSFEKGSIIIKLEEDPDWVLVRVKDDGVGIPLEHQDRIFEMYEQVHHEGLWKTGGSGLGLALCRQILLKHKGFIEVESISDQGSEFTVRLPIIPNS
ncbi:MAG TPA: hypothetical protein DDW49_07075 [Deltaproteobacteria bacterium]|nr:MAG: hypothetical protein A2048_10215 [Deltaproteobacteria bacterium GWA2_45_12]HBF13133.1 hypothetical protein [Deltaproteobacteria bacterium]